MKLDFILIVATQDAVTVAWLQKPSSYNNEVNGYAMWSIIIPIR